MVGMRRSCRFTGKCDLEVRTTLEIDKPVELWHLCISYAFLLNCLFFSLNCLTVVIIRWKIFLLGIRANQPTGLQVPSELECSRITSEVPPQLSSVWWLGPQLSCPSGYCHFFELYSVLSLSCISCDFGFCYTNISLILVLCWYIILYKEKKIST